MQYKNFKKMYVIDENSDVFKRKLFFFFGVTQKYEIFEGLDSPEPKLNFVRIYFQATTFDRITKDKAAKFVDILSAIGGTMGLLTGFSIISGVEIIYFAIKILHNMLKKILDI